MSARRGATLVEVLVASALFVAVLLVLYQLASFLLGSRRTSAVRLTGASFLRQDARVALEKLVERIEHGIEVLEPPPGTSAAAIVFRDLLNHRVRIARDGRGRLVSAPAGAAPDEGEGPGSTVITTSGKELRPAPPVEVPNVSRVAFHAASPTQLLMELTLAEAGRSVTVVTGVRLRNGGAIDE